MGIAWVAISAPRVNHPFDEGMLRPIRVTNHSEVRGVIPLRPGSLRLPAPHRAVPESIH